MIDTAPGYSRAVFDPSHFARVVAWASRIVDRRRFDAIAACGHSGLLLLGAVSLKTGVPAMAVRKVGEASRSHSSAKVHVIVPGELSRYAFLDDMVASGHTLVNVIASVREVAPRAELAAILTYCSRLYLQDLEHALREARYNGPKPERYMFESLEELHND